MPTFLKLYKDSYTNLQIDSDIISQYHPSYDGVSCHHFAAREEPSSLSLSLLDKHLQPHLQVFSTVSVHSAVFSKTPLCVNCKCVFSSSTAMVALHMWGPHSSIQFSHQGRDLFILDQDLGTLLMLTVSKKCSHSVHLSCSSYSLLGHISYCQLEV